MRRVLALAHPGAAAEVGSSVIGHRPSRGLQDDPRPPDNAMMLIAFSLDVGARLRPYVTIKSELTRNEGEDDDHHDPALNQ
jgi:hypothetical protein